MRGFYWGIHSLPSLPQPVLSTPDAFISFHIHPTLMKSQRSFRTTLKAKDKGKRDKV